MSITPRNGTRTVCQSVPTGAGLALQSVSRTGRSEGFNFDGIWHNLIGEAPVFRAALALLCRFAATDLPVLIEGETGTGKELIARALHYLGPRRAGPFVPVNCAAMPESMIENELFGHRAGAYTDARGPAEGLVAAADSGTLFLDEADMLSPHAQAALLRFLQSKEYRRLGGGRLRHGDVRVIAATNASLEELVAARCFRIDLFYRLNVARIELPPLRQRPGDVRLLAEHFLRRANARASGLPKRFAPDLLRWLESQPWPGNVRELESFIEREVLLTDGPVIQARGPEPSDGAAQAEGPGLQFREAKMRAVNAFEADYLRRLLTETRGNVSEAARRAGTERRAFGRLLKKHGIDRRAYLGREE